jgi:hypothetical protein
MAARLLLSTAKELQANSPLVKGGGGVGEVLRILHAVA